MAELDTMPDFRSGQLFPLEGFALDNQQRGRIAHPILTTKGLILPNPAAKGFALFTGMPKPGKPIAPAWIAEFGLSPAVESTPVEAGPAAYTAFSDNGIIHMAKLHLDTGLPEFLEHLPGKLSPGQTPAVSVLNFPKDPHGQLDQGVIAWAATDSILVARFGGGSLRIAGRPGRRLAVLRVEGLARGEFFLSPVITGGEVFAITNLGRAYSFSWRPSLEAIRAHGMVNLRSRQNAVRLGPPLALGGTLAWLTAHAQHGLSVETFAPDRGFASVSLEANGKIEPASSNADPSALDEEWVQRPIFGDGSGALCVPSCFGSGCFEVRVDDVLPRAQWHKLNWSLRLIGAAGCRSAIVLVNEDGVYAVPSLWDLWRDQDLPGARYLLPEVATLGSPVLGEHGLYLLTNMGLLAVPAVPHP